MEGVGLCSFCRSFKLLCLCGPRLNPQGIGRICDGTRILLTLKTRLTVRDHLSNRFSRRILRLCVRLFRRAHLRDWNRPLLHGRLLGVVAATNGYRVRTREDSRDNRAEAYVRIGCCERGKVVCDPLAVLIEVEREFQRRSSGVDIWYYCCGQVAPRRCASRKTSQ